MYLLGREGLASVAVGVEQEQRVTGNPGPRHSLRLETVRPVLGSPLRKGTLLKATG